MPSLPRLGLPSRARAESNSSRSSTLPANDERSAGSKLKMGPLGCLSPDQVEHLVLNTKGRAWAALSGRKQDEFVELGFEYWRKRGFPHYKMSGGEIARDYGRLDQLDSRSLIAANEIRIAMAGVKLANFFHPQMWSVPVKHAFSPAERFEDDASLRRLIRHALHIWPERKAINEINLRAMLRTFSHTTRVSNFRPTAAKVIYELLSKDGDTVIDFSAGYGGRLLGCLPLRRNYVGIDPCREQIDGMRGMMSALRSKAAVRAEARLCHGCAEDILPALRAGSASLIFSSPPYFDLERYSEDPSQSYLRYPDYAQWREGFLGRVIAASRRVLKPQGSLVINVADVNGYPLVRDTREIATPHFRLVRTLKLRLPAKPYLRNQKSPSHKYEEVFVFRKK